MLWFYSVLILIGSLAIICLLIAIVSQIEEEHLRNAAGIAWFLCWLVFGVYIIHTILTGGN